MTDAEAIRALIHEYAFRLDAGDLAGVGALFEHATLESDGRTVDPATLYDGVILYDDGTPRTLHQLTNVTVHVDGDAATARSYFTVLQRTAQGLHPILAGEYRDRFARVEGTWRFRARAFHPTLIGDLSNHYRRP